MATAHLTRRHPLLCFCIFLSSMLSLSHGRLTPNFKIRAVNLGGWLVTEGWIKPSLFHGIPNKDFLDGTKLQFKSVTSGKYLSAETGGGSIIVANRTDAHSWETFKLWRINETSYQLRVHKKQFVGVDSGGNGIDMVATVADPGRFETFEIVRNPDDRVRIKAPNDLVRIKAPNGFFLQVKTENLVTADSKGNGSWGNDDQSVFNITITGKLHGEFQLTNGYGPVNASQVMTEHWNTFIVEDDFKFISCNGINAVRIPVGKYGINVIIDLHAAPGSQNGEEHSSSRDGSQEWGLSDQNIQKTVNVIDFLTSRYASNPCLYAVELINEPRSPHATLESLNKYYRDGYNAVRKYSSTAYVIMSNRLNESSKTYDPKEFFSLASGLDGSVIDIHYYNLYLNNSDTISVQQSINFIYNNRSRELNQLTTSNGPLIFIGEWVAEWGKAARANATKEDYIEFANAQLDVYGNASFGWAYWTLKKDVTNPKKDQNHWSLEWKINNHYINL
ncbi:Glucan 1,3-beta-glucosidase [Camellia lanceoleosa]|uniref:Glucan 1,3-beta-glucosidase n=1 Tax=Camellia lanceoleosa TaxID=1840588 RepID=A0ACC0FSE6_9ERIC|nr:Glucan 1,3-beta-glucosidase [Camellia lanceoleosa]